MKLLAWDLTTRNIKVLQVKIIAHNRSMVLGKAIFDSDADKASKSLSIWFLF
jgi:hypothetical protein